MWLKGGRSMGASAAVGVVALVAIEYAANGGRLTARPQLVDTSFHARLDRGACYGACPVYAVDVDAAGHVRFVGARSVAEPSVPCQGEHGWRVDPSAVAALEAEVDATAFFALKGAYRAGITDQPTNTVSITRRGGAKTVVDYAGLRAGMPRTMVDLENAIDAAANDRACVVQPEPKS
jgi:hypothetical protein